MWNWSFQGEYPPFSERPICRLRDKPGYAGRRYPAVEQDEEYSELIIYYRLVKMGLGDFYTVQKMTAREVLQALNYENFISEYELAFSEMNIKG